MYQNTQSAPQVIIVFLPAPPLQAQSEVARIVKLSAAALAGFLLVYILLFAISARFPYIKPGDNLVADYKHSLARHGNAFASSNGLHVMAFGYSKTLAGFKPAEFDSRMAASGFPVESYNFGLPGDSRFVDDLEAMAARGTAPRLALLTFPWPAEKPAGPTVFHFINNDEELMLKLFPFRHLPRDLAILLTQGHGFSGLEDAYEDSERSVHRVERDRGYYFIARQSHYENDELPPDLSVNSDRPAFISSRAVTLGPVYDHLAQSLAAHRIYCLFVPQYYRRGEFAVPPAVNTATEQILSKTPNVDVAGPDYWLFPNRNFSDPTHANRRGASLYTEQLAGLVAGWLKQHPEVTR